MRMSRILIVMRRRLLVVLGIISGRVRLWVLMRLWPKQRGVFLCLCLVFFCC